MVDMKWTEFYIWMFVWARLYMLIKHLDTVARPDQSEAVYTRLTDQFNPGGKFQLWELSSESCVTVQEMD